MNGVVLVIGGSRYYHGAPLFCLATASQIVDLVLFYSPYEENTEIARNYLRKLKEELAEFIAIEKHHIQWAVEKADSILIGPGLWDSKANKKFVDGIIKKYSGVKKFVLDADAVKLVNPRLLNENCVLTPHSREFELLFKMKPTPGNAVKAAKQHDCIILLKGKKDVITDGKKVFVVKGGNAGLTKGGTGDVLSAMLASFACKNPLLLSARAASFTNKLAGDLLFKEKGFNYNASDLYKKIPFAIKKARGL